MSSSILTFANFLSSASDWLRDMSDVASRVQNQEAELTALRNRMNNQEVELSELRSRLDQAPPRVEAPVIQIVEPAPVESVPVETAQPETACPRNPKKNMRLLTLPQNTPIYFKYKGVTYMSTWDDDRKEVLYNGTYYTFSGWGKVISGKEKSGWDDCYTLTTTSSQVTKKKLSAYWNEQHPHP